MAGDENKFMDKINKSRELIPLSKKGGRPPKSEADTMSEKIFCNVTKAEKECFDTKAAALGLTVAGLLRMTLKKEGLI